VQLPESHLKLLALADGMMTFHGYFRSFGVDCATCVDMRWWNDSETWKFAWTKNLDAFLAFGETAWGDQYAYDRRELSDGVQNVYLLDAFQMEPELIAGSFEEFVEKELLPCSLEPYDQLLGEAVRKLGALEWSEHVTYIPSLLLGGEEQIENVHKLNGRASMVINGDLHRQVAETEHGIVRSLETFTDAQGRLRTKIVWQ
jgi:hypothetical protein